MVDRIWISCYTGGARLIMVVMTNRISLEDHVQYLQDVQDRDLFNTLKMIRLLISSSESFHQAGFTNYDFSGVQRILISSFLGQITGSEKIVDDFENMYRDYVNMFSWDYQNPVDFIADMEHNKLFTMNSGFFKKFQKILPEKTLEKIYREFLQDTILYSSDYHTNTLYSHESFINTVLWYLVKRYEPVELGYPGVWEILYHTINGVNMFNRNKSKWISGEQKTTYYFHHINSLTGKNITLNEFRNRYKHKTHFRYWEKICCKLLSPYAIWWAKYWLQDYQNIKFMNSLLNFRNREFPERRVKGKICCIFCNDFFSTERDVEMDYGKNNWIESVNEVKPSHNSWDEYKYYRQYRILLQDRENATLHLITRVGYRNVAMNSFFQKLRNGDVLNIQDCAIVCDGGQAEEMISALFDNSPLTVIETSDRNIQVEKN